MGATPSGLISNPPPSSPIFTPDALPATTLPLYRGLGQAPKMLAWTPSGLVKEVKQKPKVGEEEEKEAHGGYE